MAKATSSDGIFGVVLAPGERAGGGRYLLKRLVGRGHLSEVWLARDVKGERDVALKFIPRAFSQDATLLELLQDQLRRNRLLMHPRIIPVHELALDHDTAAIVMDFVDGWSLATLKVDKLTHCYTVEEIAPWIEDLCTALACAHSDFGMVHGDLKPSNLLADATGGIQVSDFGFAVLIRNECSKRGIVRSIYSGIGFLSPQQIMGAAPSPPDDIYSLGATIFDLLTGTPPFHQGEIIAQVCSLKPPAMTQRLKQLGVQCDPVSPVWEETVAACLAKNPGDRPAGVDEVARLLKRSESQWTPVLSQPAEAEPNEDETDPPDAPTESAAGVLPPPLPLPGRPAKLPAIMFAGVFAALLIAGLAAAVWWMRGGKWEGFFPTFHLSATGQAPGALDKSFAIGTRMDNSIKCLALQEGGSILAAGYFTNWNGIAADRLVRLSPDGKPDAGFAPQPAGPIFALAVQNDGKIIIGGQVMQGGRRGRRRLVRLNADGSLDEEFGRKSSYNRDIRAIALQQDGCILVAGSFTRVLNKSQSGLVRLNADGSPDASFDVGAGAAGTVWSVAVQPDGKILAAGEFRKFNKRPAGRLVRLNPDGSGDSNFNDGAGADGTIYSVLLQKDAKILICGDFNEVNGMPYPHLARLNPDGSLDSTFHPEGELANGLCCLAIQSDGKILVGGRNILDREPHPFLVRLNPDGSRDANFQTSEDCPGSIWQLAVQPDGRILVAGYFTNFDAAACGNIVRVEN